MEGGLNRVVSLRTEAGLAEERMLGGIWCGRLRREKSAAKAPTDRARTRSGSQDTRCSWCPSGPSRRTFLARLEIGVAVAPRREITSAEAAATALPRWLRFSA